MASIGTTFTRYGRKALLCGSGELGKEVAIELERFGVQVVALDKYEGAPAMHVANSFHVIPMLDGKALREVIEQEKPDYIIPEIEAIATDELVALEQEGYNVIPTANAARLTMNREGIRRLAAETLGLPTSRYAFASAIGVSEFASDREYSRPTFCTSGFCASIMSRINSVFSASDVPVT